jgi:ParB/RepB/Spo0J family partition protein
MTATATATKNSPTTDVLSSGYAKRGLGGPLSVQRIELRDIVLSPAVPNPRQQLEGPGFAELLKSIQLQGVLTPVLVRPKGSTFELIAGGRRYHASKQLKLVDIPSIVREMTDLEATTAQLAENDDREPLTGFEEGAAYAQAIDKFKLNRDAVADIFGKSRAHIYSRLRLHALDAKVKKEIQDNGIPDSIADLIATIPDSKRQLEAVDKVLDFDWADGGRHKVVVSFRAAKKIVEEEFRVSLKNAPFDLTAQGLVAPVPVTKDPKLAQAHGPCTTCPKRSGNVNPDSDSPNICTEPACYAVKARAGVVAAAKKYTDIGIPLLPEAESKKLWQGGRDGGDYLTYNAKFVKVTDSCSLDKQGRQYKDIVDKHGVKAVAAASPSGKVVLLYRQSEVQKALIAAKIMKPVSDDDYRESPEAKAKREAKEKLASAATAAVVGACVERVAGNKLPAATQFDLWMVMLRWREASGEMDAAMDVIRERRGWKDLWKEAEKLSVAGLQALLLESFLIEGYGGFYETGPVEHLAKMLKVDTKAILKKTTDAAAKETKEAAMGVAWSPKITTMEKITASARARWAKAKATGAKGGKRGK